MADHKTVGDFIQTFVPWPPPGKKDRIRLHTLVRIRWVAVAGQLNALVVVHYFLGYPLPIVPALVLILASGLLNLTIISGQISGHPLQTWLSDGKAAIQLGLDTIQLSLLLFLTGGLINPFAVLILAPITISATVLSRRSTIILGILSITCISLLAFWYLPLPIPPEIFYIPPVYITGIWAALLTAIILLATYNWYLAESGRRMSQALSDTQTALAREQRLSAMGGLATAVAHELGSPLNTISVVAKEINNDIPDDSPLAEDVSLLVSQSERCREILAALAQRPKDSEKSILHSLPISGIVAAATEPYMNTFVDVVLKNKAEDSAPGEAASSEPLIKQSPEFIHGLGGLVHNAVDFANKRVVVLTRWDDTEVTVEMLDDGPGFPQYIIQRLGDPYLSTRSSAEGHMGLGIFISQTLLGRTGAVLSFSNRQNGGALVTVKWPRWRLKRLGTS
ncbi:MAG: ActS/PrrB/RegB family redox-sensitive histidine kinase [Alphaproteobacteria bacterium]|nr:ActS/PrrB/RegB family redox-sensitive histidine kinase [Alphaproteobacteria bacterium]